MHGINLGLEAPEPSGQVDLGMNVADIEFTLFPFMSMETKDALKETRDLVASEGVSFNQAKYAEEVKQLVAESGIMGPVGEQGVQEITAVILLSDLGVITETDLLRVNEAIGGADILELADLYKQALPMMPEPTIAVNVAALQDLFSKGLLGPASMNNISNTILNQNNETDDKRDKRGGLSQSVMGEFVGKDRMAATNLGAIDYNG